MIEHTDMWATPEIACIFINDGDGILAFNWPFVWKLWYSFQICKIIIHVLLV